jgi:hypothetical protein
LQLRVCRTPPDTREQCVLVAGMWAAAPCAGCHAGRQALASTCEARRDFSGTKLLMDVSICRTCGQNNMLTLCDCELSVCSPAWAAALGCRVERAGELCACVKAALWMSRLHEGLAVEEKSHGVARQQHPAALRRPIRCMQACISVRLVLYLSPGLGSGLGCTALLPVVPCILTAAAGAALPAVCWQLVGEVTPGPYRSS